MPEVIRSTAGPTAKATKTAGLRPVLNSEHSGYRDNLAVLTQDSQPQSNQNQPLYADDNTLNTSGHACPKIEDGQGRVGGFDVSYDLTWKYKQRRRCILWILPKFLLSILLLCVRSVSKILTQTQLLETWGKVRTYRVARSASLIDERDRAGNV